MAIDLGNIPTGTPPTAGEKLQIRSAIGVGTTDAPTFLAQTLTGQSLTGTQATSLVDLATTWLSTTGTPTAIKLNVTDTANVPAASKLLDLQLSTVSKFRVGKGGGIFSGANAVTADGGTGVAGVSLEMLFANYGIGVDGNGNCQFLLNGTARSRVGFGVCVGSGQTFSFSDLQHTGLNSVPDVLLYRDAAGILAQRNGVNAQAFRVYNTYPGTTANEWFEIDWKTTANSVRIGTNQAGTGGTRQMILTGGGGSTPGFQFNVGSAATWIIDQSGAFKAFFDNTYDIGASGGNRPRNIFLGGYVIAASGASGGYYIGAFGGISSIAAGIFKWTNGAADGFDRLQLGGTTSAFPAIKRNGAGIDIRLADDSAFAPVKGKLTTDTNYTVGVPSATGYLTIYDATGTAYRVPCTV